MKYSIEYCSSIFHLSNNSLWVAVLSESLEILETFPEMTRFASGILRQSDPNGPPNPELDLPCEMLNILSFKLVNEPDRDDRLLAIAAVDC